MSRSGPGENINFRGLNASIFVIFFFTTPKISRGVHFLALEYPKMQCKVRTVRTTASTTVRILHSPSSTLLPVRSTFRDLYYVWRVCRHHGSIGKTITGVRGWVGASKDQTTGKYVFSVEYYV